MACPAACWLLAGLQTSGDKVCHTVCCEVDLQTGRLHEARKLGEVLVEQGLAHRRGDSLKIRIAVRSSQSMLAHLPGVCRRNLRQEQAGGAAGLAAARLAQSKQRALLQNGTDGAQRHLAAHWQLAALAHPPRLGEWGEALAHDALQVASCSTTAGLRVSRMAATDRQERHGAAKKGKMK